MYNPLSVNDVIEAFRAEMLEKDIEFTGEIIPDGKLHRFHCEGDSTGSKNGFYILHFDERPAGQYGCNKRYGSEAKFNWQYKNQIKMSAAELAEYKARNEKARLEREAQEQARFAEVATAAQAIWAAAQPAPADHPYLLRKGIKPHNARIGTWSRVNEQTGEVWFQQDNALLISICDRSSNIHSLQAIFPEKSAQTGRDKDYLAGGRKRGLFHPFGRPVLHDGVPVFILCEGFATGASIHEATGHLTMACFDAGNLPVVARLIYDRLLAANKRAVIILAADNDRWTTAPVNNPGVHHAREALKAIGDMGRIAIPEFTDLSGEPTDFNDLHQREGLQAVADMITAALPQPEPEPEPDFDPEPEDETDLAAPLPEGPLELPPSDTGCVADMADDELERDGYFTVLGYDGPAYYIFHHDKGQVMELSKSDFTDNGMIELAPLHWWEENFPGEKGMNKKMAANWFFRLANSRGIYDPSRIRGRGAWRDKGRHVFHLGDQVVVDGQVMGITHVQSRYVYQMARRMPEPDSQILTNDEGANLLRVASMVRWSKAASAPLLAGWTFLAPICGALKWRPHIWITGSAGSGKSTIQNMFCSSLMAGIGVNAQGNSTEAGIRQELRADALPVLIDEAESSDDKERARMEAILSMIRQASSESQAKTLKGTISGSSNRYNIRSMFCLASINTNIDKKADIDRLTKLVILPPKDASASEEHWRKLSDELHKITSDETIAARMLARALYLMPVITQTVDVFCKAAARHFGSQREGDQFGTLMAGAWSLSRDVVPTEDQALAMITAYNWDEHTEDSNDDDAGKALEAVLGAKIKAGMVGDVSIYELIRETSSLHRRELLPKEEAVRLLVQNGIKIEAGGVCFGTSITNLKALVSKTAYVTDLRGQLLRLPGASRNDNRSVRFNGFPSKCVVLPMSFILAGDVSDVPPI